MKTLSNIAVCMMATSLIAVAGRPIIMQQSQACSEADIVVLATVEAATNLPDYDPFEEPKWSERFTQIAESTNFEVLLGESPSKLSICGGKAPAGIDYRLQAGDFLLLLKKVGDGYFRAVDWNYSFMPTKNGKVEWMSDVDSNKTEWITIEEAIERIKKNKKANKAQMATPRKLSD